MSTPSKTLGVRFDRPLKTIRLVGHPANSPARASRAPAPAGLAPPLPSNDNSANQQVEDLFNQMHERLDQLEVSRNESMTVIHQIAIELSVAIAGKILFSEIKADQFPVREMVDELLGTTDSAEPVTVALNPADLSLLQAELAKAPTNTGSNENVKWLAGPELKRGSARMDLGRYSLFYDGVLQLNEIRQSLLEMASDAEIERRKSGGSGTGLRRFPDRRASG